MSQDLPAPPSPHAATADAEDSLAMLLGALAGEDLPDDLRNLLQQAADALQVAIAVAAAERQRYRALFDAVPDPVSVLAWDGTVLDLNRAGLGAYKRRSCRSRSRSTRSASR